MTSMLDGVRAARARARAANITTTNTFFPMAEITEFAWMKLQLGFLYDEGVAIGLFLRGDSNAPWENVLSRNSQPNVWEKLMEVFRNLGDRDALTVRAHWGINSKGQRTIRIEFPKALAAKMISIAHPGDEFGPPTPVLEPASLSEPEFEDNEDDDEEWEKIEDNDDDDEEWEKI